METVISIATSLEQFGHKGGLPDNLLLPQVRSYIAGLILEAKAEIDLELGPLNDFSLQLAGMVGPGSPPLTVGSASAACWMMRSAVRQAARARERRPQTSIAQRQPYVAVARIAELKNLPSTGYDYSRLIEMCRELNVAHENDCHMSTGFLLRSILNHVPPVFGHDTFAKVASQFAFAKSVKPAMARLQGQARDSADLHLHQPIRQKESLPTAAQVAFSSELDMLLGEVIRVARGDGPPT